MLGGLLSAGASLLGGLFGGGSSSKNQVVENRVDYKRMVREAEAAGFNPLTALRNGGAAGFSVQSMPSMTNNNIWGDAIGQAFNAWNNYDPHAQKREGLTHDLMQAQLANIQADTELKTRRRSFDIPVKIASQTTAGNSIADAPSKLGMPKTPDVGDVAVTNPWQEAVVSPNVRDAQNFEDRYGDSEVAQMLYGAYVGGSDLIENLPKGFKTPYQAGQTARQWLSKDRVDRTKKPKSFSNSFDVIGDLYKGGLKPRLAKGR